MKLSHSKLSQILTCPMSYHLNYDIGLARKETKPALWIGSAVHYGIEHSLEDLSDYFEKEGSWRQGTEFTREQLLSEAMVHGYLKHKDELFEKILEYKGEKLEVIDELHELYITGKLKSEKFASHDFVGIIDLLLLTNKGFIIIDYKTSTYEPNWDGYLDQLYRYIFLLKSEFPDVPVLKIAIINIRKTGIRQKKTENQSQFLNRLKLEYDLNDDNYVNYHEFNYETLDERQINDYINNLTTMADAAETIVDNQMFFINYGAAMGQYGKSDYYDIFYHTPDAHIFYTIKDSVFDEENDVFAERRDCVPSDMLICEKNNVMYNYSQFYSVINASESKAAALDTIHKNFVISPELLNKYLKTYEKSK